MSHTLSSPGQLHLHMPAAEPYEGSPEGAPRGLCLRPGADAATGDLAPLLQHRCRLAGRHGYNVELVQLPLAQRLRGVSLMNTAINLILSPVYLLTAT
jgi:hypothetical protein